MTSFFVPIVLALLLFVSTNVDDIFVLVGFFADRRYRSQDIVVGQFAGIGVLYAASVAAALLSIAIPKPYIGFLGIIPVIIGLRGLWNLFANTGEWAAPVEHHPGGTAWGKVASVALVTISSGEDNLAVYIPSFAVRSHGEIVVMGFVFAVLTALWCFLAYEIVSIVPWALPFNGAAIALHPSS
jgi:cadmium resistance protein CadD (predicted permease)